MPLAASAWEGSSGQAAGRAEVFGQPRKGKVLPVGPAQPQPDQEQPVGLDGPPVAQPLEGAVGLFKISAVFGQTLLHPAAQLFRQGLPEEDGGPQPVFGAQAGFQRAPGAAFACGGVGHAAEPVGQQGGKGVQIPDPAGQAPGFAQVDKDGVPVEGVGPLGVPGGDGIPLYRPVEMDGLTGGLHLPVIPEEEGAGADLLRPGDGGGRRIGTEPADGFRRGGRFGPEGRSGHTRSPLSASQARAKRPQGPASSRQTASAAAAMTAQRTKTAPQPKPSAAAPMPQVAMAAPR